MHQSSELWPKFRDNVSVEQLRETTERLFEWQRHSGTSGEYQAVAYLKERLDALGIAATVEEFDALISNPLQASLTIHAGERRSVQCLTHPFSANAPGGITGEVVFAGDEPGDVDVAGKIAIIDGPGTPFTVNQWLGQGAAGIICHSRAKVVQDYIISGVWGTPEPETANQLPSIPVISIDDATGSHLRSEMQRGSVEVTVRTRLDTGIKRLQFPVADVRGNADSEDFVLLAGHLDSWYFGAQDNAAGDASLLEIARVLHEQRDVLGRNVRIAWWVGHSHGRFAASAWYCDAHWEELARHCVGYLNVDQPGHRDATWLRCFSTPEAARFLKEMVRTLSGQEVEPPRPPRNADQSFWGLGLPSFSYLPRLKEGSPDEAPDEIGAHKPWYQHTPFDTIDKLDFDLLAEQTYYFCATMAELSTRRILPWDQADLARAFRRRLDELAVAGGTHLDLSPCFEAAQRLEELGERVNQLQASDGVQPEAINRALLRCSQHLLNVYYTEEGRYHQAPAVVFPFLPGLREAGQLKELDRDSEQYLFLKTKLRRERNRVAEGLRWAAEEIESALRPHE